MMEGEHFGATVHPARQMYSPARGEETTRQVEYDRNIIRALFHNARMQIIIIIIMRPLVVFEENLASKLVIFVVWHTVTQNYFPRDLEAVRRLSRLVYNYFIKPNINSTPQLSCVYSLLQFFYVISHKFPLLLFAAQTLTPITVFCLIAKIIITTNC